MIFLAILLSCKIPRDSYTVIEYIIRPIRIGSGGVFYISNLIPLVLLIIGITGFMKLDRFARRNKLLVFLLIVVCIIPFMKWTVTFAKTSYYSLSHEQLKAVEINEPDISFTGVNDKLTLNIKFKVTDYSQSGNHFHFKVYLPDSLSRLVSMEAIESQQLFMTDGNGRERLIEENIEVTAKIPPTEFVNYQWYDEDATYELYNEKESVQFLDRGL